MSSETNGHDTKRDHALILSAWLCVLGDARISYLSGPITTGPRWAAALEHEGEDYDRSRVIADNSSAILAAARKLRAETPRLVVEPASLSVREWSQDDYLTLWTTLIERHAADIYFMPGWEYSIGCALEFERALLHSLPAFDIEGNALAARTGFSMLAAAIDDLGVRGARTPALLPLLDRLRSVLERVAPGHGRPQSA